MKNQKKPVRALYSGSQLAVASEPVLSAPDRVMSAWKMTSRCARCSTVIVLHIGAPVMVSISCQLTCRVLCCFARRQRKSCQAVKPSGRTLESFGCRRRTSTSGVPTLLILATFVGRGKPRLHLSRILLPYKQDS
jgi:hypothetical protein